MVQPKSPPAMLTPRYLTRAETRGGKVTAAATRDFTSILASICLCAEIVWDGGYG